MFKIHPLVNLINLIIFLLLLIFTQNTIFIFIIMLLLLINAYRHPKLIIYLVITLIVLVINILCGKLFVLGRILSFIGYFLTIFVDYSKIDFIRVYDTLFSSTNYERTKIFLKCIYFKELFKKHYDVIIDSTRKIGYKNDLSYYIFCIRKAYNLTLKSLNNMIYTYEKRFYFNSGRNKYKIVISVLDILMLLIHLVCILIVFIIGV